MNSMDLGPTQRPPEFDEYAAEYEQALNRGLQLTGEGKEYFAQHRIQWLFSRLSLLGHQTEKVVSHVLDFGCGIGTASPFIKSAFLLCDYLGFDPSTESIQIAKSNYGQVGVTFTTDPLSIPNSLIDLAFTNGVFHHIPPEHRAEAAGVVWRALKPGGWFAFWENNRWNPMVHFIMSRVPFDRDAQMLFPHQARRLLRGAGFEIALTDYLFVFPAALKSLRPLEPSLCKLPLGGQYLVLARKPLSSPTPHAA